jgi:hypothetical protein
MFEFCQNYIKYSVQDVDMDTSTETETDTDTEIDMDTLNLDSYNKQIEKIQERRKC